MNPFLDIHYAGGSSVSHSFIRCRPLIFSSSHNLYLHSMVKSVVLLMYLLQLDICKYLLIPPVVN
jgi:hypothetical protein